LEGPVSKGRERKGIRKGRRGKKRERKGVRERERTPKGWFTPQYSKF